MCPCDTSRKPINFDSTKLNFSREDENEENFSKLRV